MITISQEAQEFLCGIEYPEGKILRLEEDWELGGKHHASFQIGAPKDDDEVLEREGETLLHVARPNSAKNSATPGCSQAWQKRGILPDSA